MDKIQRGQQAQRILEDPLFREAVDTVRAKILKEITDSLPGDREKREWLYTLHKGVGSVESLLAVVMNGGKIEAHHLEKQPGPDA